MDLMGTYRATRSEDFQARVRAAMVLTAVDITNGDLPQGHPRDVAALRVLQDPESTDLFTRFVWLTAANPAIAASVSNKGEVGATDNDIHYVVSGAWYTLFPDPEPIPLPE